MLHYNQLNGHQKEYVCNGCGGKGGIVNPPEFLFHASCNHHDFLYWRGYTETDRESADNEFYRLMKVDISNAKWYSKPYYHIWAFAYYKFVRSLGKKFFYYGEKPKDMVDLISEMRRSSL